MTSAKAPRLFEIVYAKEPGIAPDPGFEVLDNRLNPRPDWREYWPIREFLATELTQQSHETDAVLYGFFSPKFGAKVQLSAAELLAQVQRHQLSGAHVVLFSPQADMGAFFHNVFEQAEIFDPGITETAQAFFKRVGFAVNLERLIMDSRQIVFSNFFVACGAFWKHWFAITEQLFAICEGPSDPLQEALTKATSYPGAVQRKVFVLERIASVLLAVQDNRWRVRVHNPFLSVWSLSGLRKFRDEAIISDALKLAFRELGFEAYGAVFERIRKRINTLQAAKVVVDAQDKAELDLNDLPQDLLSLQARADSLVKAGDLEHAVELYRRCLALPGGSRSAILWFAYASLLARLQRHSDAEGACRQAIFLQPKLIVAYLNLGLLLERLGRTDEACEIWQKGSQVEGIDEQTQLETRLALLNQRGRLLEQLRRYDQAEAAMKASLMIQPLQSKVLHHWIHIRQKQCKWPVYEPFGEVSIRAMVEASSPLATMAESDDPATQLACARRTVAERVPKMARLVSSKHRYRHQRTRLAYVSGDLCMHAVGLLMVELLEQHDKSRFEIYAYCWSKDDGTALQHRIRRSLDHHIPVGQLSDLEVARKMVADEIDIAIDLQGLTSGARPAILASGPAPIQISYLGYPGSCAIPYVDYVVADSFVFPKALERQFAEIPIRLKGCFQTSDRKRPISRLPSRASLGLPTDRFVFCAFNNNYKFTEQMFKCWMRILKATPNSLLWLLGDNPWSVSNMKQAAQDHGVQEDRLVFAPRVAPPDYLARFTQADLYLDTFPYNAGTTANDVLWMGLPLLTRSGKTYISRMAGSLLHFAGLDSFICNDMESYEKRAIELATEPHLISIRQARRRLGELRERDLLFNTEHFARDFEARLIELQHKVK